VANVDDGSPKFFVLWKSPKLVGETREMLRRKNFV
jgi:hypothetical protein